GTDESQWDRFDTIYRRAARISIERGRSIVARISANRNLYSKGIDAAGRTFAAIIAIGHYRRESPGRFDQSWERPLVSGLRNVLQLVIQQADESALDAKVLMTEVTTLARNSKDGDGLVARAVSFAAHALQELVMQWEDPQPDQSSYSTSGYERGKTGGSRCGEFSGQLRSERGQHRELPSIYLRVDSERSSTHKCPKDE